MTTVARKMGHMLVALTLADEVCGSAGGLLGGRWRYGWWWMATDVAAVAPYGRFSSRWYILKQYYYLQNLFLKLLMVQRV